MNWIRTLTKETPQSCLALPLCEDRVRGLEPRRGSSPEPDHSGGLVSDVPPQELWKLNACSLEATQSVGFCHRILNRVGHTVTHQSRAFGELRRDGAWFLPHGCVRPEGEPCSKGQLGYHV